MHSSQFHKIAIKRADLIVIIVLLPVVFLLSKTLTSDQTAGLFVITMIILLPFVKKSNIFLSLLILFSINIFGAVKLADLPHLRTPGFGTFQIQDGLLVIAFLLMVTERRSEWREIFRSKLVAPVIGLLVLNVFAMVQGYLNAGDFHYVLNRSRSMFFYLVFFFTGFAIRSPKDLSQFGKILLLFAIISSLVGLWQFFTGQGIRGASQVVYMKEFGLYRTYQHNLILVSAVLFGLVSILWSGLRVKSRFWLFAIILLIMLSVFISFGRNIWGATLLGLLFVFWHQLRGKKKGQLLFGTILLPIMFLVLANTLVQSVANISGIETLVERSRSAVEDVRNVSGSFGIRTEMLTMRLTMMWHRKLLFGYGYKGTMGMDPYSVREDPTLAFGDNTWAEVISIFGFLGLVVFVWLIIAAAKELRLALKVVPPTIERSILIGLGGFYLQQVVIAYFGSLAMRMWGVSILAGAFALVYLIRRFHEKGLLVQYVQ